MGLHCGVVLPVRCGILAVSLASTHQMPVTLAQLCLPKMSPDIAWCLLEDRIVPIENHCIRKYHNYDCVASYLQLNFLGQASWPCLAQCMHMISTGYPLVNESFFIEASRIIYSGNFWVVLEGLAFWFSSEDVIFVEMPLVKPSLEESFGLVDSASQQIHISFTSDI